MNKFKCCECGINDVEDEDEICDDCFYDADENEDIDGDEDDE
jgi:NMD protein affecting ribosome stability and mRNA decay